MVAALPPPILGGGDLKISDQNIWGDLSKALNLGGAKFKGGGGAKILEGAMNPNDVLKDCCVKRYSFILIRL